MIKEYNKAEEDNDKFIYVKEFVKVFFDDNMNEIQFYLDDSKNGTRTSYKNYRHLIYPIVTIKNAKQLLKKERIYKIAEGLNDFLNFVNGIVDVNKVSLTVHSIDMIDEILESDKDPKSKWCAVASLLIDTIAPNDIEDKMNIFRLREPLEKIENFQSVDKNKSIYDNRINFESCFTYLTPMFPVSLDEKMIVDEDLLNDFSFHDIEKVTSIVNIFHPIETRKICEIKPGKATEFKHKSTWVRSKKEASSIVSYLKNKSTLTTEQESDLNPKQFVEYYNSINFEYNIKNIDKDFFEFQYKRAKEDKQFLENSFLSYDALPCFTLEEIKSLDKLYKAPEVKSYTLESGTNEIALSTIRNSPFFMKAFVEYPEAFTFIIEDLENIAYDIKEMIHSQNRSLYITYPNQMKSFILKTIEENEKYNKAFREFLEDQSIPLNMMLNIKGLNFYEFTTATPKKNNLNDFAGMNSSLTSSPYYFFAKGGIGKTSSTMLSNFIK